MTLRFTAIAAAGLAAAAAIAGLSACTSSSAGTGTAASSSPSLPATTVTTSAAPTSTAPTTSSAAPTTSAASTPPTSSPATDTALTSSPAPTGELSCTGLDADAVLKRIATFHDGGALPSGVPLPQAVPSLTCVGTGEHGVRIVAVSWTSLQQAQYGLQLTGGGWKHQRASNGVDVYQRSGAPKTIVLTTLARQLVALYGPPQ